MKKITVLFLALMLVFTVACGSTPPTESDSASKPPATRTPEPTDETLYSQDDLDRFRDEIVELLSIYLEPSLSEYNERIMVNVNAEDITHFGSAVLNAYYACSNVLAGNEWELTVVNHDKNKSPQLIFVSQTNYFGLYINSRSGENVSQTWKTIDDVIEKFPAVRFFLDEHEEIATFFATDPAGEPALDAEPTPTDSIAVGDEPTSSNTPKNLALTLDEFQSLINNQYKDFGLNMSLPPVLWNGTDKYVFASVNKYIEFSFFMDAETQLIESLIMAGTGDGSEESGATILVTIAEILLIFDSSLAKGDTGSIVLDMMDGIPYVVDGISLSVQITDALGTWLTVRVT